MVDFIQCFCRDSGSSDLTNDHFPWMIEDSFINFILLNECSEQVEDTGRQNKDLKQRREVWKRRAKPIDHHRFQDVPQIKFFYVYNNECFIERLEILTFVDSVCHIDIPLVTFRIRVYMRPCIFIKDSFRGRC